MQLLVLAREGRSPPLSEHVGILWHLSTKLGSDACGVKVVSTKLGSDACGVKVVST